MRKILKKPLNNKGFSLVELIIVIAIMAILLGVMAPNLIRYLDKTKEAKRLSNADTFRRCYEIAATEVLTDGTKPRWGGEMHTVDGVLSQTTTVDNRPWNTALKNVLDDIFTSDYENIEIYAYYDATGAIESIAIIFTENRKQYNYVYAVLQTQRDGFIDLGYEPIANSNWLYYPY